MKLFCSPQYTKYNIRYTRAYTLIELLVGLTIVGLLFGFGFVSFRDFSRRQAIEGAAKKVQGDLRLAQSLALAGKKPNSTYCNDPNILDSYSLIIINSQEYDIEANCSGGIVLEKAVILPSDVTISTPNPNPIKFKILGQGTNIPAAANATLVLTQAGTQNQMTVTISSGGEIR